MSSIRDTAEQFFDACETGKGWDGCQEHCHAGATFSSQAGALEGVDTLEGYTEWMKGLLTPVPDGHYEVRSFAVDDARKNVAAQRPLGGASKRMLVSRRPSTGATSFPETTKSPAVAGSVD